MQGRHAGGRRRGGGGSARQAVLWWWGGTGDVIMLPCLAVCNQLQECSADMREAGDVEAVAAAASRRSYGGACHAPGEPTRFAAHQHHHVGQLGARGMPKEPLPRLTVQRFVHTRSTCGLGACRGSRCLSVQHLVATAQTSTCGKW